jgi:hypothetical protein
VQVLLPQLGSVWQAARTVAQSAVEAPFPRVTKKRVSSKGAQQVEPAEPEVSEGVRAALLVVDYPATPMIVFTGCGDVSHTWSSRCSDRLE